MKKLFTFVFVLVINVCLVFAQAEESKLLFKLNVKSKDNSQILNLLSACRSNEVIEGYVLLTNYEKILDGKIVKGGFSFLDSKVFGLALENMQKKWVENDFPIKDLEVLTNGVDVSKILSFKIKPILLNPGDDSISLFFQYCVYNLKKQNEEFYDFDFDYNIKFFYKLVKIPFNSPTTFDFIEEHFKDYDLVFLIEKNKKNDQITFQHDQLNFFREVINSAKESKLIGAKLEASVDFIRTDRDGLMFGNNLLRSDFLLRVRQNSFEKKETLLDETTNEQFSLDIPIYYAGLNFPFRLFNPEKEKLYAGYKTRENIFQCNYDIILVPMNYTYDTLTVELFITYSKLNLDNIQRWTPIKKRLQFIKQTPVEVYLPKENWSANFTISNERYEIYGYSDYERYANEYLLIYLESTNEN